MEYAIEWLLTVDLHFDCPVYREWTVISHRSTRYTYGIMWVARKIKLTGVFLRNVMLKLFLLRTYQNKKQILNTSQSFRHPDNDESANVVLVSSDLQLESNFNS